MTVVKMMTVTMMTVSDDSGDCDRGTEGTAVPVTRGWFQLFTHIVACQLSKHVLNPLSRLEIRVALILLDFA
jgi:hypothetical protein